MSDKAIILFFPLFSQLQDGMGGKKLEQGQVLSLKRKKKTLRNKTVLDIF